jgi:nucleotide-binding universal stress UspA family protein
MSVQTPTPSVSTTTASAQPDPFARLLVPIDFSSAARAAFALAMSIADRWDSRLILFHAAGLDENDEFLQHTGVAWGRSDVVGDARDHLRRFADTITPGSGARVEVDATHEEDAVRAVLAACSRYSPSLIVLGSHPKGRLRFWRSRVERILRAINCPVMVVRGTPEAPVDADM